MNGTVSPKPANHRLGNSVSIVLLLVAVGALTGACYGLASLILAGTIQAGFWKTTVGVMQEQVGLGAIIGAACGVAMALFRTATEALGGTVAHISSYRTVVGFLANKSHEYWLYLVIQSIGLAAAVGLFLLTRSKHVLFGSIMATILICVLVLVAGRLVRAIAEPESPFFRALTAALAACIIHLVVAVFVLAELIDVEFLSLSNFRNDFELLVSSVLLLACPFVTAFLVFSAVAHAYRMSESLRLVFSISRFIPAVVVLLAALSGILSSVFEPDGFEVRNPKNILIIAIDTVRQDHTSILGQPELVKRSPNLWRLAENGIVFEAAISQAPWTIPAFGSIMTGKYPHEHGAVTPLLKLRGDQITLAEILKESGYTTGGAVSNGFVGSPHGFAQGYDYYNEDNLSIRKSSSKEITDASIKFIEDAKDERFFFFAHYFDPHGPYLDYEAYDYSEGYAGWLNRTDNSMSFIRRMRHFMKKEDIGFITSLYDEEIFFMDTQIGRLLDYIDHAGLTEDTAIVVVADHGEEFMDHGTFGHALSLHDELIKVPLVFVLPGTKTQNRVVKEVVETRAIFSTILDYIGLGWSSSGQVMSLLPVISISQDKRVTNHSFEAYSVEGFKDTVEASGAADLFSLRTSKWKLIINKEQSWTALYDVEVDPGETKDLSAELPERLNELRDKLNKWISEIESSVSIRKAPLLHPSQDKIDFMRQLGY